jgi:two-component system LytT family response regulator
MGLITIPSVLIVEDEVPAQKQLLTLLNRYCTVKKVQTVDSVETCLDVLNSESHPDLAFFDIHLADGDSFEVFSSISIDFPVVFTTAFSEYALKAFQLNSIHYLLKPIEEVKFRQAIDKYEKFHKPNPQQWLQILSQINPQKSYRSRFLVRFADKLISVDQAEVAFFLSAEKSVIVVDRMNRQYRIDFSLDELEVELSPSDFYRLNRQILARRNSISEVFVHLNGKLRIELTPKTKEDIFVSRERAAAFKIWMGDR